MAPSTHLAVVGVDEEGGGGGAFALQDGGEEHRVQVGGVGQPTVQQLGEGTLEHELH